MCYFTKRRAYKLLSQNVFSCFRERNEVRMKNYCRELNKYHAIADIGTMSIYKSIGSMRDWVLLRDAIKDELASCNLYCNLRIFNCAGVLVYDIKYKLVNGGLFHKINYKQEGFALSNMWCRYA